MSYNIALGDFPPSPGAQTLERLRRNGAYQVVREAMEADPDSREEIQLAAEISRKLLEGREVTL